MQAHAAASIPRTRQAAWQLVYTAPAAIPTGGLVVITATSSASSPTTPANQASALTTIVALPPSLSWTQAAPPASLVATTQAQVSATVANDASPGGVNWSVTCGAALLREAAAGSRLSRLRAEPQPTWRPRAPGHFADLGNGDSSFGRQAERHPPLKPDRNQSQHHSLGEFRSFASGSDRAERDRHLIASMTNDTTAAGVDWESARAAAASLPEARDAGDCFNGHHALRRRDPGGYGYQRLKLAQRLAHSVQLRPSTPIRRGSGSRRGSCRCDQGDIGHHRHR